MRQLLILFVIATAVMAMPLPLHASEEGIPRFAIASVGTGIRLAWYSNFSFALDWGYVLRSDGITKEGDSAIHFKTMLMY